MKHNLPECMLYPLERGEPIIFQQLTPDGVQYLNVHQEVIGTSKVGFTKEPSHDTTTGFDKYRDDRDNKSD